MDPNSAVNQRLDQVVTQWSLLRLAHEPASLESKEARQRVLLKYNRAIRSYVGALLQNDDDADEVAQDVLVRLLKGDFANANPGKGRFRDFLKVAVKNMVRTYWSKKQRRAGVNLDVEKMEEPATGPDVDHFNRTWQTTILDHTLKALQQFERSTPGCCYYTVMKLRKDFPDAESTELAERMSKTTKKTWTPEATRQQLRRSRLRFAQLLVEEVAGGISNASPAEVEAELIDLGLMEYVRPFLPDDWRDKGMLRDEG